MNGQISDLNETQLRKGTGVVAKWLKEEQKLYDEQVTALKDAHEKGIYSQSEYNKEMEKLNAQHKTKMEAYGREYAELQKSGVRKYLLTSVTMNNVRCTLTRCARIGQSLDLIMTR